MIVRLVLEHDEPFLVLAIDICLDDNAASIDFLRFVEIFELALFP